MSMYHVATRRWRDAALLLCLGLGAARAASGAETAAPKPAKPDVKQALATLRGLHPANAADRQALRMSADVSAAWQAVVDAGAAALPEVKAAVAELAPAGGADDYFRLLAGGLLWRLGGLDAAADAAKLWADPKLDLGQAPMVVHSIAYQAARTRDPRALPLMFAAFRDTDGMVDLPRGGLSLGWPDTALFIWAAYGPDGRAALAERLNAAADAGERASAVWLLTHDGYAAALPAIRTVAKAEGEANQLPRQTAIRALGAFGHPDDFAFLADGLKKAQTQAALAADAPAFAAALAESGDPRAADLLLAHLEWLNARGAKAAPAGVDAADRAVLRESALALLDPVQFARLRQGVAAAAGAERAEGDLLVATFFAAVGVPQCEFDCLAAAEQAKLLDRYRRLRQGDFVAPADAAAAAPASRADVERVLAAIAQTGSLPFGTTALDGQAYPTPAQFLAGATAGDIDALLEARVAVARNLTPEALRELDVISAFALRLARTAYRPAPTN